MLLAGFEDGHGKSVLRRFRMTSSRERASSGFGERRRLFEQAAEGRRFQQVSSVHLPVFDLQFRENRRRLRRPGGRALAPETAQPGAQLPVARLALEDPLDHELGCDGAVPVIFLEPKSDVELQLPPKAVELAAKAECDCAAGVARAVLDPEAKVLAVSHRGDIAQLAPGNEQGDGWIA